MCVVVCTCLSLTDDSTETFWESREEPRGRARTVTATFNQECRVFAAAVHIDNQKDSGVCDASSRTKR